MRAPMAVLAVLLVGSNAAWLVLRLQQDEPATDPRVAELKKRLAARDAESARLAERVRHLESAERRAARVERPAGDAAEDASAAGTAPAPATTPPGPTAPRPRPPSPVATPRPADAEALAAIRRAKADALQIEDAARREQGLADIGTAIRSADPAVARAALLTLRELRDAAYDKRRFRDDVLARVADADQDVRSAALYAFVQVERAPGDADRLVALAAGERVPDVATLHVALMLDKSVVDGALARQFVRALEAGEGRRSALDVANLLRGATVTPEVEDAVVAAFRLYRGDDPHRDLGLWPYILGQMRPGPRESRVRVIFELLATGNDSYRQLAGPALTRGVDESARPVATQLAAAALGTAQSAELRRDYIEVIRVNGGPEQVPALRALAANTLAGQDVRDLAAKAADALER